MADRNLALQLLITARDQASEIIGRIRAGLGGVGDAASAALSPLRSFWGLVGAGLGLSGAKELNDYADAYTRLSNSLKVATKSEQEFNEAEQTVVRIAKDTRSALETTAQLYARIHQNRKAMNVTEKETADLTELISKGMQLGGASAQEYASATLQLTQAFGAGVLRGEEFNSVMEASPELMRQLATGLGVTTGELRGLAEQGVLTSTVVSKALLSQKDAIDAAYSETTQTVEQSFEQLKNTAILFTGKLNEQTGATRSFGEGLAFLSRHLDAIASLLGAAVATSLAKFVQGSAQAVTASLAARDAARQQAIAEAARQREILATAQANVAAAQASYNRALAEQRLSQQIVMAMQAELGYGVTETELAAARTRAAGAAQVATAATERYTAAQAALNAIQAPAAASAGLFGRALGFLAGPGGLILTAVTAMGLLYSAFATQKKPTDDLTQSTEDYTAALKKMSTAQAEVELNTLNDQLAEQRQRVEDAKQAYDQVANSERGWITVTKDLGPVLGKVNQVISDANEIARIRAKRHAELDAETQKLALTEERRAAAQQSLSDKQRISNEQDAKQLAQYVQTGLQAEQLSKNLDALTKHQKDLSNAEQERLQSQIALAEANGDYAQAEAASIAFAKNRAQAAQQQAVLDGAAAEAAKLRVTSLENEYKAYAEISPVQAKALTDARLDAAQKQKQAEASAALSSQLAVQATHTEQARTAQQKMLELTGQYAQGVEDVVDAQTAGIRAELELAKAKGHTASVQELTRKLAIAEAEGAARVAKAKEVEQVAEYKLAVAKRDQLAAIANKNDAQKADLALAELVVQKELAEAQAAGVNAEALEILAEKIRTINILKTDSIQRLTEVTDDNTDTTEQNTDAQKKSTEAIEDGGSAISGQWAKWGDLTESMSDATHQMFLAIAQQNLWNFGMNQGADAIKTYKKELAGQTEGIQNANAAIADLTAQLQQSELSMMRQGHAAANISRATESIENAGIRAALAYQKQRLELENLLYAVEQGEGGVQQLNKATHYADTAFNLLGDEDLSRLRAAIADAKSKMDGLRQASADALDEAQRALLQQQGDDLALAELERKKTVLDLQKQLNDARAAGDKDAIVNLEKAISLQNQVFDMKTKEIQQAAQTREREKATASSPTTAVSSATPTKTYQLDLVGTNGRTFTATTTMDPSAFLDELETAKRRSLFL